MKKTLNQNMYAALFLHLDGWTVFSVVSERSTAKMEVVRMKKQLPDYKYQVVPCVVCFKPNP